MFAVVSIGRAEEIFEVREDKLDEDKELDDGGGEGSV